MDFWNIPKCKPYWLEHELRGSWERSQAWLLALTICLLLVLMERGFSYCICMCFSHKPHQQILLWSPENATWGEEPPQEKAFTLSPNWMTLQRCLWGLIYTTSKVQYSETTRCWPKLSAWSRCLRTSDAKTICAHSLWQRRNTCPHRNNGSAPD